MKLKLLLLLLGVIVMSDANASEPRLYIRSLFDIQYAFCDIKTNGVTGVDNRDSALEGRGFGTSSTASMLLMANGENEVSLEFGALGWFSSDALSDKDRNHFNPEAKCTLELTAMRGKKSEVLTAIEVAIDKNGQPVATTPANEAKYAAISTPVVRHVVQAQNIEDGHVEKKYFNPKEFPPNMTLYRFSRSVRISGLPDWEWVKATPYTDTLEQRQQLQQAYMAVWQAYNAKDINTLMEQQKVALKAWAWATNESEESIFADQSAYSDINEKGFKMKPINWDDYTVKIMNQGRMVRLVNKSDPENSPISYYYVDEDGDTILATVAPIFSLINGRFVQVI
ncbi:hypothetical protein TI10_14870 [Photorhabdus luminescens subsp. luminescens]|uniref:Uncharacterized protein n=1 Tax=Photorhabdus luminescens TaxID=29488 RepID=A0A1G5RKF9_PHOLU|nr:hypothetical protein [Photorhabdus luminescens]KMW72258.1 hypothetical protein TI10_14870 [Photorhabdus luminescens subsp. luminescens]SCZ73861.1 hypothetical protein SAMN02982990_04431 [Photorhabdus luminescens]